MSSQLLDQLPYPLQEGDRGEVLVYSTGADGMISPLELSTWLVKHLIHTAQIHLRESITGAVVTVPAHFDHRQRGATQEAVNLAGIKTVHLLQEPVAAALAYGIDGGTDGETVLVFDIGGGTFDVSVLQAFEGIMQVLTTGGDSRLGGDDFDLLLADWILDHVEKEYLESGDGRIVELSIEESEKRRIWALEAARRAKEALSDSPDSVCIPIPSFFSSSSGSVMEDTTSDTANEKSSSTSLGEIELTQEMFEIITRPLFERMAAVLNKIGNEVFVEWAVPPEDALYSINQARSNDATKIGTQAETEAETEAVTASAAGAIKKQEGKQNQQQQDKWAPPPRRISKVALVGQITRLPSVRHFIQTITKVEPCTSIDPGAAVALGAATHAGVLLGSVGSVELMDGSFVSDLHSRVTGFSEWQP